MQQRCEVCENFRPEGDLVPGRKLLLCRAHAGIAANSNVTTFEELRELYTEQHGSRSYVPRRAQSLARTPGRRLRDARG
jgi:hypothetical protein